MVERIDNTVRHAAENAKTAAVSTGFGEVFAQRSTLDEIFKNASERYGVPEVLLKAVAKAESGFNPNAVSRAGAQGIMQLMPSTAAGFGVTDPFDPAQSIMGGAKLLSRLLEKYNGDVSLTLAAYNSGAGSVDKYGGVPPFAETRTFIDRVLTYSGGDLTIPSYFSSSKNPDDDFGDLVKLLSADIVPALLAKIIELESGQNSGEL